MSQSLTTNTAAVAGPAPSPRNTLTTERLGDVLIVMLNRPEARNAVNLELCLDLIDTFGAIDAELPGVVVIGANGPTFCAGADLKERQEKDSAWIRQRRLASFAAYRAIVRCRVPVIAYLQGAVVGSGGEIALSCDFAYAQDDVSFRYPEVHWGTIGATQRLQRVVGVRKAKELLFTNSVLDAADAVDLGLVQKVINCEDGWDFVLQTAKTIAEAPTSAVQLTKNAIDAGSEVSLDQGLDIELRAIETNLAQGEWKKGLADFATRNDTTTTEVRK
ncbi:enoyl-CoA hydratase/isomerase family protein [Brevibacterium permense]|uniref:enoyl-CoA hydratase/isomerase family protein n=1 Tax=Brevibacterium permense TaxID=234834 RepID=UPI0021CFBC56|nr:enoyl-CoA hydratase/isomerase family protein [Brevibacterium permense]MCU4298379.1 enoyl-CoA hydratase/isomerase family protein [Brevibacterium permense]